MKRLHQKRRKREEGFTLVEMIMAFGLLAYGLVAVLAVVGHTFVSVSSNDETASAIKEAQNVMNSLRASTATAIAFPSDVVVAFPPGTLNPPRTNLPGEVVDISYENPNSSPLIVTVRVQYLGSAGRPLNISLSSAMSNL